MKAVKTALNALKAVKALSSVQGAFGQPPVSVKLTESSTEFGCVKLIGT